MRFAFFSFASFVALTACSAPSAEATAEEATAESGLVASQVKVAGSLPLDGHRVEVSYVDLDGVLYTAYAVDLPAPMRLVAHGRTVSGGAKPILFLTDARFTNLSKSIETAGEARIECQLPAAGRYFIAVRSDSYQDARFQLWIDPLVDEEVPCHGVCSPGSQLPTSGTVSLTGACRLRERYQSLYCPTGSACYCGDRTSTTELGTLPLHVTLERVGADTRITIPGVTFPANKVLGSAPGATFLLSGSPESQSGGNGVFSARVVGSHVTVHAWKSQGRIPARPVRYSSADCGYGGDELECELENH